MGADLDIIIEHRMTDGGWRDRVWSWGIVEVKLNVYRGYTIVDMIRDGVAETQDGFVERALAEDYYGHVYQDGDKRQSRTFMLPTDVSPTAISLLRQDAFEAYWLRVAPGQWFVDFVRDRPWDEPGNTKEPEAFVKIAALVSSLLALDHEVRLYMFYGQ